jgi:hypothetical protein
MASENQPAADGGTPVDTTTMLNKEYRTRAPADSGDYLSAAEAFNDLCHVPGGPIPLADGREILIREWHPRGDEDTMSGYLRVSAEFLIRRKRKEV